jgi:transposase
MEHFAAYIALDWSDEKHDVALFDPSTARREAYTIKHSAQAINEWATELRKRFAGEKIAVCLEQSRGPLIFALLKYDFFVLYPINPKTLAKYREAFSPSGAKDDPSDTDYLLDILLHHRDRLKGWLPDDEKTRTLQYLVEHRRKLVNDRTRLSNRMSALLKLYFPQVLCWFDDLATVIACDFLLRWPTLDEVKKAKKATLEKFLREHNSVRRETNERRMTEIREAVALTTDRAVINSAVLLIKVWAEQMKTISAAVQEFDREIDRLCQSHQDCFIFNSLPGAGPVYTSRLTAAFGTDRTRWSTVDELLCLSGVAPVIERSGKSEWIRWRYFCPKFLRQSFVEYAGESVRHSFWARAYYQQQREKGKSHQAVVRALAFKWIRIIWKCWQDRKPYDEVKHLESLRRKGSPLLQYAAADRS